MTACSALRINRLIVHTRYSGDPGDLDSVISFAVDSMEPDFSCLQSGGKEQFPFLSCVIGCNDFKEKRKKLLWQNRLSHLKAAWNQETLAIEFNKHYGELSVNQTRKNSVRFRAGQEQNAKPGNNNNNNNNLCAYKVRET